MESKKYYWSFELYNEFYTGPEDSIQECIKEARDYHKEMEDCSNNYVFIGELKLHIPVLDSIQIMEILEEDAYEECGECSEGWFDGINQEQKQNLEEKLNDTLREWLEESNKQPTFGAVINVKKYDLQTGKVVEF